MKLCAYVTAIISIMLAANTVHAETQEDVWKAELAGFDWAKETSTITDEGGNTYVTKVVDAANCETQFRKGNGPVNFAIVEHIEKIPAFVIYPPEAWLAEKEGALYRVIVTRQKPDQLSTIHHSITMLKPISLNNGVTELVGFQRGLGIDYFAHATFMVIVPVTNGDAELETDDGLFAQGAMIVPLSANAMAASAFTSRQCIDYLKNQQPADAAAQNQRTEVMTE